MSATPGFFSNLFGRQTPTQAAPGAPVVHGSAGRTTVLPTASPQQNLQPVQGQAAAAPAVQEPPVDPLDSQVADLAQVWHTPTNADGKPVERTPDPLYQPLFNTKKEEVIAAVNKVDFTQGLNPELASKALGGDAGALVELINGAVRASFAATQIGMDSKLNDGFARHSQSIDQALPTRLKRHAVASMQSEDPILQTPAISPFVEAMKQMIANNNPNLRPEQVQQAAEQYVTGVAGVITGKKSQAELERKQQEEAPNWMQLVGLEK